MVADKHCANRPKLNKELNKEVKNEQIISNEEVSKNEINESETESDKKEPDTTVINNINTNSNESATNITDI